MTAPLQVLCAGAVKGLVEALAPTLPEPIAARFGAVGALRDALRDGAPCDVLIVTDAIAAALEASGVLVAGSRVAIGSVRTGIAVVSGAPMPAIDSGEALARSLLAASAVYFPDADRSTAGAHVMAVIDRLGLRAVLAARLRMLPNGATAMAALAASGDAAALGCTQVTEIRHTAGLDWVGALPSGFELATVYSAAVAQGAADPARARRFTSLLAGAEGASLRLAGGFDIAGAA